MPDTFRKIDADVFLGQDTIAALVAYGGKTCLLCGSNRDYAFNGVVQPICYGCSLAGRDSRNAD